jgi:predicted ATPase/DNA-binding SARP family transcriptional activator/tetratricopeptide (TPR) repeat protein
VEFRVLGTLEVLDSGGHPVELRGSKLRTLLAALILRAGQPVSADQLFDLLWGDTPPSGAANALQAQVSKLRRLLTDAQVEGRDGGYVLSIDAQQIDFERFTRLAKAGHDHLESGRHAEAAAALREGLALWRGAALADFAFEEFAQPHRTRLEEMRLTAIEDRIDADLIAGRHEAVAAELEGLVREHGLRERLWAQLMMALYRCDRQSDSLRAFQRARDLLADELGLDPGPALRELERQVLAHDPALSAPVAASRTTLGLSNIHPELSTFVGRSADVEQITKLLERRRLVSITGPGGVGKTRIATEIALQPGRTWRDGAWLVELGVEAGDRAVASAFQRTFGPRLGHTGGDETIDWLTTGLATTELLIVLDNCEHVLADAAEIASAIVRSCPGVTVLATSREPLGVPGESVRALEPLGLDDAMHLFASRAADSDGEFVLDDASSGAVATICDNVDRLPLAIELTAARTRAFSAQQLAELLDRRFGLVSTISGGRPQRQQTIHAAVDWSYDLLFDDERRLLSRLSVFAGGFTLDAAARVCADDTLAANDIDVLIARLVDKSLVATQRRSSATPRFRLLRPVADYAAARLEEAGETALLRTRHTRWLIDFTAGLTAGLRGPASVTWAHLANVELANLARSAEWGLGDGDPIEALQIGVNLGWYAFLSANIQNDEPVMLELLERAGHAPVALRCRALMWSGLLSIGRTARRTWAMDAIDVARTAANAGVTTTSDAEVDGLSITSEAIALARTADDPALLLETLVIGSLHLGAVGSLPDVLRTLNDEARVLAKSVADPWHVAVVAALDGLATYVAGDLETSMAELRGAIEAFRALRDNHTAALFEITFSEVAELRGDIAGATSAMAAAVAVEAESGFLASTVLRAVLCWLMGRNGEVQRSLELGREVVALAHQPFNPVIRAQALFALGVAETLADDPDSARDHLGEALAIHQQVGMKRETAMDHRHLGILDHMVGDREAAIGHLRRAVQLAAEVGLPWTVMLAARSIAEVIVDDQPEVACQLLGSTEALAEVFGYVPTPDERHLVDTTLATATTLLGATEVARATAAGAQLSHTDLPGLLAF